eukprot:3122729-Pyramimonas_sp.AAC.1
MARLLAVNGSFVEGRHSQELVQELVGPSRSVHSCWSAGFGVWIRSMMQLWVLDSVIAFKRQPCCHLKWSQRLLQITTVPTGGAGNSPLYK